MNKLLVVDQGVCSHALLETFFLMFSDYNAGGIGDGIGDGIGGSAFIASWEDIWYGMVGIVRL